MIGVIDRVYDDSISSGNIPHIANTVIYSRADGKFYYDNGVGFYVINQMNYVPERYVNSQHLNKVQYFGMDYQSIYNELLVYVKSKFPDITDIEVNTITQVFLNIMAYLGDNFAFYMDRIAGNLFLETTNDRRYVEIISRQLGYVPGHSTNAETVINYDTSKQCYEQEYYIKVTPKINNPSIIPEIPAGFVINSENGVQFQLYPLSGSTITLQYCDELKAYVNNTDVKLIEGNIKTVTFIATGEKNYRYFINELDAISSINVKVDGVVYDVVDYFTYGVNNNNNIKGEVKFYYENKMLQFGDGKNALYPSNGQTVEITYHSTKGNGGNIPAGQGVGDNALTYMTYNLNVNVFYPYFSGGSDSEDIDAIKNKAPIYKRTTERLITLQEVEDFILQYQSMNISSVDIVKLQLIRGLQDDLILMDFYNEMCNVINSGTNEKAKTGCQYVYDLLSGYLSSGRNGNVLMGYLGIRDGSNINSLTPIQLQDITNAVNDKLIPTVQFIAKNLTEVPDLLVNVNLHIYAKMVSGYSIDVIESRAVSDIQSLTFDYGQDLDYSDIEKIIANYPEVDGVYVRFYHYGGGNFPNGVTLTSFGLNVQDFQLISIEEIHLHEVNN